MKRNHTIALFNLEITKALLLGSIVFAGLAACGIVETVLTAQTKWLIVSVAFFIFCILVIYWLFTSRRIKKLRRFMAKHDHYEGVIMK